MRKVQETVNRTREQSARRKMDKMQSREWDSDKKAERWQTAVNPQQPTTQSSAYSTTRTNSGDGDAEAETSPTVKPREERNRGRGSGRRGRGGRGRGRGEVRDRAPPGVPQAVEEKAEGGGD
jgi:hypothetical protein